jgi:hypothetical protein
MLGGCLNSWQTYGCEWNIGYLWRWTNWISRLDVFLLALMLAYIVIVVSRGSYHCHLAGRQSRAFVRDATGPFRRGAFQEVITIAARTSRSPVATMVVTGLTAFASAPWQFTLTEAVDTACRAFQRAQRTLAVDLNLGVGTLKSISFGADAGAYSWEVRHEGARTGRCSQMAYKLPLRKQCSESICTNSSAHLGNCRRGVYDLFILSQLDGFRRPPA